MSTPLISPLVSFLLHCASRTSSAWPRFRDYVIEVLMGRSWITFRYGKFISGGKGRTKKGSAGKEGKLHGIHGDRAGADND